MNPFDVAYGAIDHMNDAEARVVLASILGRLIGDFYDSPEETLSSIAATVWRFTTFWAAN